MTAKTETRRQKLTAASAKISLPENVDDLIVKDTDLVGFQLRIRKASKRWIFSGRVRQGPRRQVILGDAETMPCAMARAKAIDDATHRHRHDQADRGRHDQRKRRHHHHRAIGPDKGPKPAQGADPF